MEHRWDGGYINRPASRLDIHRRPLYRVYISLRTYIDMKFAILLLVACACVHLSIAQDPWSAAAGVVLQRLGTLFDEGSFELFDHNCQYKVKPSFAKFKLTYKGKVWCPGWTSINGGSRKKSKNGAIENAIQDFVNKVRGSGLVSDADAQSFLEKYRG